LNSEGTKYVLHELKHYSDIRNIPLVIVGRSNEESEKKYYRDLVGEDIIFVNKNEKYDTYKYLDESEVSVTTGSSIGYETVSRGNKNAFFTVFGYFNKTNGHGFGWPAHYADKGLFWVNYPDQKEFFRILDYLFEIDHEQWNKDIQMLNFSSLITYNPDNSIFKSVINKEIEN
jgi:surface carbohydrate biosynthesis protein